MTGATSVRLVWFVAPAENLTEVTAEVGLGRERDKHVVFTLTTFETPGAYEPTPSLKYESLRSNSTQRKSAWCWKYS